MSTRDPEGRRLPVRIDSTSNGEFEPVPLSRRNRVANALAQDMASRNARRRGIDRRGFMISSCGAASTLLAVNQVNAATGKTGGFFALPAQAGVDPEAARAALDGREFIFDVQGHYVNPDGQWLQNYPERANGFRWVQKECVQMADPDNLEHLQCLRAEEFIKDVFLDSDTDMMVLSFVPSARDGEPLTIEEADQTRRIVEAMDGDHRLLLHGRVNPNQAGDLEDMERLAENFPISAWKTYTQWGPDGHGFHLHDDTGLALIERARSLGVKNIAIHKGLPFGRRSYEHSRCDDVGVVARQYPDVNFVIYHSGFDPQITESAFEAGAGKAGVDSLVQSLIDNEVAPNSNVYAELGSTWRFVMRDPDQAAHLLGKLITHCGEQNVLWGTDSIWYGSPQDQIQAFRSFQISPEFRERYGYPELTPALKAKIFGLNATVPYGISLDEVKRRASLDSLSRRKQAYLGDPDPSFETHGPRTRREFMALRRLQGSGPA